MGGYFCMMEQLFLWSFNGVTDFHFLGSYIIIYGRKKGMGIMGLAILFSWTFGIVGKAEFSIH